MTDPVIIEDEYDLDAAAAEAQADKPRFCFRWKGQSWSLKHISQVDLRTLDYADGGDAGAMRAAILTAMGPEQAKLFNEVEQEATAIVLLFNSWTKHAGMSEGESLASSASSASTAGRSRPASRSTTRGSGSGSSGKARSPRAS